MPAKGHWLLLLGRKDCHRPVCLLGSSAQLRIYVIEMSKERLYLFDTTLRDGAQTTGVDFSLEDKRLIAAVLDELGVDYIEGGYPGANVDRHRAVRTPTPASRTRPSPPSA